MMKQQHLSVGERRRVLRNRTFKPAKIVFNHKSSVIDCTARNLSVCGARLQVADVVSVPEQFELLIDGASRPAKTVWRADGEIGIQFVDFGHGE
jgi:hypothetical protein